MSNVDASTAVGNAEVSPDPKRVFLPLLMASLLAAVVSSGSVLGTGYWLLHSGRLAVSGSSESTKREMVRGTNVPEPVPSKVVALDSMIVNLADAGGHSYLRAGISLRLAEGEGGKKEREGKPASNVPDGKTAALRDATLAVLSVQTSEGLLGANGVAAVKKQLLDRYGALNTQDHVLEVYFTDFLVQRG